MKKLLLLGFVLLLGLVAYARVDVGVGLDINAAPAPVYSAEPPAYYAPEDEAYWMDAPVKVVYFDGVPHNMHWWNGRWYDEAWRGHRGHRGEMRDRGGWDGDWHRGH
jgi:hypothetical protein